MEQQLQMPSKRLIPFSTQFKQSLSKTEYQNLTLPQATSVFIPSTITQVELELLSDTQFTCPWLSLWEESTETQRESLTSLRDLPWLEYHPYQVLIMTLPNLKQPNLWLEKLPWPMQSEKVKNTLHWPARPSKDTFQLTRHSARTARTTQAAAEFSEPQTQVQGWSSTPIQITSIFPLERLQFMSMLWFLGLSDQTSPVRAEFDFTTKTKQVTKSDLYLLYYFLRI